MGQMHRTDVFFDIAPTQRIPPLCAKGFWVPGCRSVGVSG